MDAARNMTALDAATLRVMNEMRNVAISHRTGGVEKSKRFWSFVPERQYLVYLSTMKYWADVSKEVFGKLSLAI